MSKRRRTTPSAAALPPPLLASRGGEREHRIGLIVNPIAGMGGKVGLKGTDGAAILAAARERGAVPEASARATRALAQLHRPPRRGGQAPRSGARGRVATLESAATSPERATLPLAAARPVPLFEGDGGVVMLAGGGVLGEDAARAAGIAIEVVGAAPEGASAAEDTKRVARAMVARGAELIVFAGGDGTARDIHDATGGAVPMLGIPTGVKMHSGVFATSPEAAGQLLALVLSGDMLRVRLREAEIMDLDEEAVRAGRVSARLHGTALVPYERMLVQNGKAPAFAEDEAAIEALAATLVAAMAPGRLTILGCGTTMRHIKRRLGFEGTLLGVDVALDRRLLAADVDEKQLLRLLDDAPGTIITGVTGGQGFVFGRGNQPISAEVIRRVGRDAVIVVCGRGKLMRLSPPCLRIDTGDAALDRQLAGHIQVHTAPGQTMMMPVSA